MIIFTLFSFCYFYPHLIESGFFFNKNINTLHLFNNDKVAVCIFNKPKY